MIPYLLKRRADVTGRIAIFLLSCQTVLSSGCMMPMMGMHGQHEKEESRSEDEQRAQTLVMTLRRVEELVSIQRILAGQLPEGAEKRELLDRLDRMKNEIHEMVESWASKAKASQGMGPGGH